MENATRKQRSGANSKAARLPAIQATGVWMVMAASAWGLIAVALFALI
jgi:hypothetical protein